MNQKRIFIYLQAAIMAACLVLNGCGGDDWTYETDRELKPGPGIFSGEDGEFNLIGQPEKQEKDQEEASEKKTP
jgi:hypothetical protein